jgi:hypothetical protein
VVLQKMPVVFGQLQANTLFQFRNAHPRRCALPQHPRNPLFRVFRRPSSFSLEADLTLRPPLSAPVLLQFTKHPARHLHLSGSTASSRPLYDLLTLRRHPRACFCSPP